MEKPSYIVIREAANLLYSRMKISKDQSMAKNQMVYFIREARHTGWALGIDTLKFTSIDIDIRVTIDYMFIKKPGIAGIPDDLRFLYKKYDPLKLQRIPNKNFLLVTSQGSYGQGSFDYPEWHKREGEAMCRILGIEVEHGESIVDSTPDSKIGDFQHVTICTLRLDGESYHKIGASETISSGTAFNHVKDHNREIERSGSCSRCVRAKAEIATTPIP